MLYDTKNSVVLEPTNERLNKDSAEVRVFTGKVFRVAPPSRDTVTVDPWPKNTSRALKKKRR
jgi:hypothetical protein